MENNPIRAGEVALPFDPAETADDARLIYIGHAETPWRPERDCPRNTRQVRERLAEEPELSFRVHIDLPFRPGLKDVKAGDKVMVLMWMNGSRRDLIIQNSRHRAEPAGLFSLRSPVRPNPIGLSLVRVKGIDREAGEITVDALDCFDGTPILDLKPWIETIDRLADEP
ncbi:TrmO family methyltransferase [Afifella sp. IM 167]|uniref:TrmO family methyltransferase domain-containing protein n=1 Tax=Afifella sp. IM 167 TaxID=2033586 RepID=UPI001CCD0752|nr:TrmO family methyltransferase [Afifella sp. IM 167]MBZ8131667.1 tRNA (N6-threonylcarbamoyladenosine(37)-N6)-methyltransferase TrmO [Afifella sp. IM 167]